MEKLVSDKTKVTLCKFFYEYVIDIDIHSVTTIMVAFYVNKQKEMRINTSNFKTQINIYLKLQTYQLLPVVKHNSSLTSKQTLQRSIKE